MRDPEYLRGMSGPLISWYRRNARPLPWRGEHPDPYHVWVSEVMLQQTRVEAVRLYFDRFLQALPTVEDLANCPQDKLLKLWEGLGYYNRARNLQRAAQRIMTDHGARLPEDYEKLLSLPGFGPYTAGAVASIGFGLPECAVDGNVLRIFARLTSDFSDVLDPRTKKRTEELVRAIIPAEAPGQFNQALMELGEVICLPKGQPLCAGCPVRGFCRGDKERTAGQLPVRIKKTKRRIEEMTVFVIRKKEGLAIRRRPKEGLLALMYEPPWSKGHLSQAQACEWLREQRIHPVRMKALPPAKHIFSHIEWHMEGYLVLAGEDEEEASGGQRTFFFAEPALTQERYPIPGAFEAYAKWMDVRIGASRLKTNTAKRRGVADEDDDESAAGME